jgi:hypothetical protein
MGNKGITGFLLTLEGEVETIVTAKNSYPFNMGVE